MKPLKLPLRGVSAVVSEPFGHNAQVVEMAAGRSIAELVQEGIDLHGMSPLFWKHGSVCINGQEVPREMWTYVRPRVTAKGDVIVTFHAPLGTGGGGSSSKNPIAMIALIAVLVVATVLTAGGAGVFAGTALGFLGTSLGVGTLTVGGVLGTAVLVGGSLAVAALSKPPTITQPVSQGLTDQEGKPASLSANVLSPGSSIPRVIGTRRVFPPAACEPLNELVGIDEMVECVFALSGPHLLEAPRAGPASFLDILDLTYEIQNGLSTSSIQSLVTRQGHTTAPNLEASRHKPNPNALMYLDPSIPLSRAVPYFHTLSARRTADQIWIRMAWVEGLFADNLTNSDGTLKNVLQPFRFRFKRRQDTTYTNCPEIMMVNAKAGPLQKDIRLIWGAAPVTLNTPPTNAGPCYAYRNVQGQDGSTVGVITATPTDGWATDAYFFGSGDNVMYASNMATTGLRNIELYQDKVVVYLDPNTFPQDDIYDVQVIMGQLGDPASFDIVNYQTTAAGWSGKTFDFYYAIFNATGGSAGPGFQLFFDQSRVHDRVIFSRVASVWNENPINDLELATISVRIRGATLDAISVLASGYVKDWDGSGWNTLTTTSNPAPHYRDVMTGTLNDDPLPADLVDDDDLVTWRQFCIDKGYICDLLADGRPGYDVLSTIAGAGYARPRQSEKWGVLIDKDRSAEGPVQVFTPRNMTGFRFERPFPLLPDGFDVRYDDSTNDYIEDSFVTLDPLNPSADGSRLEDMRYDTFVNAADAEARAEFDLMQAELRLIYYYGTCDAEIIVCRRGDLVAVQHDSLMFQAGFSRVKSIFTSGGNITGLELDGSIPVPVEDAWSDTADAWSSYSSAWLSPRTGIAIRLTDDTTMVKEVTAASTDATIVTFVNPFPDTGLVATDCLLTAGPLTSVYERMLVFDVSPKAPDFTADVTFVPEAPQLWGNATSARILREEGLLEDLVLALDAGDGASYYPSAGTIWHDTSGQENDFRFG